jgi:CO dehydrogenase maturation factor
MILAVIGKGGVGKTTITSLLLRRLIDSGQTPLLTIDADPSSCLGSALGVTVGRTLAELREGIRDSPDRPPSMSQSEWLDIQTQQAMVEHSGFDLLTMGRPEGKGCYCYVNSLIRDRLDRLSRSYRHVLLDCEAGLEHLSRRTSGRPDVLVCVTNRSRMAAETIWRSLTLYQELHGELPRRVELMLNTFEPGEALAAEMTAIASGGGNPFGRILTIPLDPQVASFESAGHSLLDLSPTTPAMAALHAWEIHA